MDLFAAMRHFAAVADAGGFSAAARRLGLPLATVSRQVAALEENLGARLLARTTRRVALTEAGRAYYERCCRILDDLAEAEAVAAGASAEPSGRLVVSGPVLIGHHLLVPAITAFLARHAKVEVELALADRFVNLIEEGMDVAVRVGPLADSALVAKKLGTFRRVVCASPSYLRRRGVPRRPIDAARHDCIVSVMHVDAGRWHFRGGKGEERAVTVAGRLKVNDAEAVVRAALEGAGLALAPGFLVRGHVAAGRLRVVLADFELPPVAVHALYPHARLLSAKVRAFVDFLVQRWGRGAFAS